MVGEKSFGTWAWKSGCDWYVELIFVNGVFLYDCPLLLYIGSKEQCESAKTVIEECNLNSICIAASDSSSVLDSQRSPPSLPKNQAAIVNPSSLTNNMTITNPLNEITNERANSIATNRQTNLVMSNSSGNCKNSYLIDV